MKATGPPEILKLIRSVVVKQEERTRTRKLSTRNHARVRSGELRLSRRAARVTATPVSTSRTIRSAPAP